MHFNESIFSSSASFMFQLDRSRASCSRGYGFVGETSSSHQQRSSYFYPLTASPYCDVRLLFEYRASRPFNQQIGLSKMNGVKVKEDDELLQEELEEDDEELTEEEDGAAFEAPRGLIVGALRAPKTVSVSLACRVVRLSSMLMCGFLDSCRL
jgi:hypothetical protein